MSNTVLKTLLPIVIACCIIFGALLYVLRTYDIQMTKKSTSDTNLPASMLTEREARDIAENSCIKGGEALTSGTYNEYSKTWWFDADLNATQPGCMPACVVDEETKTAEINWRCTGVKNPDTIPSSASCGIENCHGLDIVCGDNPAQMCTEMYQLGDRCRQFAKCGVVNGSCKQIEDKQFTACKTCVETCEKKFPNNPEKAFQCENTCGE